MRAFREDLREALEREDRFALATVVKADGSTPQKAGARALFFSDGRLVGTLGGGCLEAEARKRAMTSLRKGEAFVFSLRLDQDFGWDDGLICGGTATVLVEPNPHRHRELIRRLDSEALAGNRAVLATVLNSESAGVGDSLLLLPSGEIIGDEIPASPLDSILLAARSILDTAWSEPKTLALPGGAGEVFFEPIFPRSSLLIVGAGHIGEALARLASRLDFKVAILDDRASLVTPERFPDAAEFLVDDISTALRGRSFRPEDSVIVVTRGHQRDAEALREVAGSRAGYVGMIGSRRKAHLIFQELLEEGLATPDQLRRVRSPIGLDIGAKSVEEIALSIAAELVAVRAKIRAGADPFAIFPEEERYPPMAARRSPKSIRREDA